LARIPAFKRQRNILIRAGFVTAPKENPSKFRRDMSQLANSRRLYPLLPRDYIRRRRAVRLISNAVLIAVFSVISAYFITRSTGGKGFPARKVATK
jgi:hypothetical protein